jgi:uncharacterized protein YjiS (DUF1127 family)
MTNHHVTGFWKEVGETLHLWRQRYQSRRELAQWADRDLHDIGVSRTDVIFEADKPFWRA